MNASEIARTALAAWEAHDLSKVAGLLADDFVLTGPAPIPLDKPAFLTFQQVHNEAFADWKFNPEVVEEQGDRVKLDIQITTTHTGTYDVSKLGIPIPPIAATGKRRQWPQESLTFTISNGRISSLHADVKPGGGVVGALEWLGVKLPAPSTMSAGEIVQRWAQLWNAQTDLALIDEIIAPDFASHSAPPGIPPGREGVRQWIMLFRHAFADLYANIEDVIIEGDKVVMRFLGGGTQTGEFFGIPPTGKRAVLTGINILRIANGQIVEHWGNSDDLGFLQQLGVIPLPQAA
jgi:steroid delta-isomerase-like uncharacterized protein